MCRKMENGYNSLALSTCNAAPVRNPQLIESRIRLTKSFPRGDSNPDLYQPPAWINSFVREILNHQPQLCIKPLSQANPLECPLGYRSLQGAEESLTQKFSKLFTILDIQHQTDFQFTKIIRIYLFLLSLQRTHSTEIQTAEKKVNHQVISSPECLNRLL